MFYLIEGTCATEV